MAGSVSAPGTPTPAATSNAPPRMLERLLARTHRSPDHHMWDILPISSMRGRTMTIDIQPTEIDGKHYVTSDGRHEMRRHGPFSADEAEARACRIAAICRALKAEVRWARRRQVRAKGDVMGEVIDLQSQLAPRGEPGVRRRFLSFFRGDFDRSGPEKIPAG